jgi:5-methylcytosine-specific restriction endonuclease McrA
MQRANRFIDPTDDKELRLGELLSITAGISVLIELHEMKCELVSLSTSARIDYLKVLQRQASWINAWEQEAIIAVAGLEPSEPDDFFQGPDDMEREDVATALRLAPQTAQNRIDIARTLVGHLPYVCSALATGEISAAHATTIAREVAEIINKDVPMATIRKIEEVAIAHAEFHTPSQVTNKVRSTIAKLAPEEFAAQVELASEGRRVEIYPEKFGMSTIIAILPAADAQTVMLAIEKLARISMRKEIAQSDTSNRLDQLRADALTQIAASYLATSKDEALNHRRPVTVNLTLDLTTLLGIDENPGILSGYGAIPASVARELAADGKWRRFITDPVSGNLLDYGRKTYEPPQALVDFVTARDRTCRFPGCRQPSRTADIDHAIPWEKGGATSAANMGLLCRRHHRMKTSGEWHLDSFPDGSCRWTSPDGNIFEVPVRPINEVA